MNGVIEKEIQNLILELDKIDADLKILDQRMALAHFYQLLGQEHEPLEPVNNGVAAILLDSENRQLVDRWLLKSIDPKLKRRLELFKKQMLNAQVNNNPEIFKKLQPLQKKIIDFQPVINGRHVSRSAKDEILDCEADRNLRKEAYWAGKTLDNMIESDLLELMDLRNKVARGLGYPDYVAMGLASQDLTETELRDLFHSIRCLTQDSWMAVLEDIKSTMDISKVQVWDIPYYQNTILKAPDKSLFPRERIVEFFKAVLGDVGGDLDQLPIEVVIQDIPYGGLCIPLKYNEDIRILSNPRDGYTGYDVLFHEFGHGIQSACLDSQSHLVAGGDPPFFWEGIAGVYQHLMQAPAVLKKYFKLTTDEIKQIRYNSRVFRMRWFRGIAVACLVEWDAYRGETDLRGAMRRYHREFMGFDFPESAGWAGNTLFTTHPLYNQNYVMMDVMACQLIETLKDKFGEYPTKHLFGYINEQLIKPAGWKPWRQKIQAATGKPLSADALAKYLTE